MWHSLASSTDLSAARTLSTRFSVAMDNIKDPCLVS